MIQFENVTKRFPGGQEALSGLTLSIDKGEMAFVTGHSGAGKSSLLKLVMLMEKASAGQVFVHGKNLNRLSRRQLPYFRRNIGVVFQDHQLLFDRNVFENVALPLQVAGYDNRDAARRVRAALDKVGLLKKENVNPITNNTAVMVYMIWSKVGLKISTPIKAVIPAIAAINPFLAALSLFTT